MLISCNVEMVGNSSSLDAMTAMRLDKAIKNSGTCWMMWMCYPELREVDGFLVTTEHPGISPPS